MDRTDGQDGRTAGRTDGYNGQTHGQIVGRTDGWLDGRTGQTDRQSQTDGWTSRQTGQPIGETEHSEAVGCVPVSYRSGRPPS